MTQPNEIHFYDFDGTLFRSPEPLPGTGTKWWSEERSLSPPCVPETPDSSWWVMNTVMSAGHSIQQQSVLAILCTGRQDNTFARWRIPELLRQVNLDFDRVYLNPGGSTTVFKSGILKRFCHKFSDVATVQIWENESQRLNSYIQLVEGLGLLCIPHLVTATSKNPLCPR